MSSTWPKARGNSCHQLSFLNAQNCRDGRSAAWIGALQDPRAKHGDMHQFGLPALALLSLKEHGFIVGSPKM